MTHHTATHDHAKTAQADGLWDRFTGKAKAIWGDLTDDELLEFEGNVQGAFGYLKQKYGEGVDELQEWWNNEKNE